MNPGYGVGGWRITCGNRLYLLGSRIADAGVAKESRTRTHSLWLVASCKFLIPFSVLMTLGGHVHWRTAAEMTPSSYPL